MENQNQTNEIALRQELLGYTNAFIKITEHPGWESPASCYPELEQQQQCRQVVDAADLFWWNCRLKIVTCSEEF
jgi:hypothetical protein